MIIAKQIFHNETGSLRNGVLTLGLVLSFQFINAQNDTAAPDTLSILPPDTIGHVAPDEETAPSSNNYYQDEEEDNDEDEKEKDYFLQKWMQYRSLESLEFRRLPDSAAQALKSDKNFWYANQIFEKEKKKKKESSEGSSFGFPLINTLLWVLIIGSFVAFLIFFLANSNVRIFRRSRTVKTGSEEEQETGDIFAINYQKEIDKAIQAGNYRLATRLMFLRLLRNLSDKNIIQYKQDRTNFDYLAQLHNTTWYEGFFRITRNYEYTWYGLFEVDREKFSVISSDFEKFEKSLN